MILSNDWKILQILSVALIDNNDERGDLVFLSSILSSIIIIIPRESSCLVSRSGGGGGGGGVPCRSVCSTITRHVNTGNTDNNDNEICHNKTNFAKNKYIIIRIDNQDKETNQ